MPDFSALQAAISDGETGDLIYFAFDLLFEGAEDLRKLPLSHRKARLQAYIDRIPQGGARSASATSTISPPPARRCWKAPAAWTWKG